MLAREGRQRALVTNAFLNRMPSRARRSMFGVRRIGLPMHLNSSHRNPSPRKKTRLGLRPVESPWAMTLPSEPCPNANPPNAPAPILRNKRRDGFDVSFPFGSFVSIDDAVFILSQQRKEHTADELKIKNANWKFNGHLVLERGCVARARRPPKVCCAHTA